MSQAPAYVRTNNLLDNSPDRTDHGALNAEFDRVATSINGLRDNLALILTDTGSLAPSTVGVDQLTDAAKTAFGAAGPRGQTGPLGATGPQGVAGEKGDVGATYSADARALAENRALYDARQKGFSFLATDTSKLYFKLSGTSGDWSTGSSFGIGLTGSPGALGPQGSMGPQGLQGPRGKLGEAGPIGATGPTGTVDYVIAIRTDTSSSQSIIGPLQSPSLTAKQYASAPEYRFEGCPLKLVPNGERIRVTTDGTAKLDYEARSFHSAGTAANATGFKLSNGADIGTLFDPAGAAASKIEAIDLAMKPATLTGKTTMSVQLVRIGNQVSIQLTTS